MTETKTAPKRATTKKATTLVEALAAFQADLPEIGLDKTNPHFKSKFASLANISKIVLPKLAEQGLAFSVGSFVDNGTLVVDAHLIHEDGTSRSAQFPVTETNPQKVGSAVTYYRRYALASLTGIVADEDDDGNAASAAPPAAIQKAQARKANPPAKAQQTPSQKKIAEEFIDKGVATREQVLAVNNRIKLETGKKGEELFAAVYEALTRGEVS